MEGSHTGVVICQALESMLENWKISKDRVHLVIADNASNMKRAIKEGQFEAQGCFACMLQLVVNDGVLLQHAVTDLLAVDHSIVGHFNYCLSQVRSNMRYQKTNYNRMN